MIIESAKIAWNHYTNRLKNKHGPDNNPYLDQIITPERAKLGPGNINTHLCIIYIYICLYPISFSRTSHVKERIWCESAFASVWSSWSFRHITPKQPCWYFWVEGSSTKPSLWTPRTVPALFNLSHDFVKSARVQKQKKKTQNFGVFVPSSTPKNAPDFWALFMHRFLGNGDHWKFSRNPRPPFFTPKSPGPPLPFWGRFSLPRWFSWERSSFWKLRARWSPTGPTSPIPSLVLICFAGFERV